MAVSRRVVSLVKHDPSATALHIHSLEVMEKVALRAKDVAAVERVVLEKLEAQRDFAAGYRAANPGPRECGARTGATAESYCSKFGFALRTVQRWAERLLDEASFEVERHQRLLKVWKILEMEQAANYSSESVEWYTPRRYLDSVHVVLGEIDLDPASSEEANKHVRAKAFFSAKDDGLSQPWFGTVFLNPPYGRTDDGGSVASAFCVRAIEAYVGGDVSAAIVLVNSVHSQKWQAPLYEYPVCFVDHRIEFVSVDGSQNENPTFQNIFVYLGKNLALFADEFSKLGYVMVPAS